MNDGTILVNTYTLFLSLLIYFFLRMLCIIADIITYLIKCFCYLLTNFFHLIRSYKIFQERMTTFCTAEIIGFSLQKCQLQFR